MKLSILLLCLFPAVLMGQDPITDANKCYEEKNYECAVNKYKEAISSRRYQEKEYATIKYRIGNGLNQLKKYTDAIQVLKDAIASQPDYKSAHWSLSWAYYSSADYSKATDSYQKAIELYKSDTGSVKTLYYWRGRSLAGQKKYADAIVSYKEAMKIDSTVDYYYASAGDASYDNAKYKEAIVYYRKSIELGKTDKKALSARYYWMGQALSSSYQYEEALKAFKMALEHNPDNMSSYWGMAGAYFNQSKYKDAITNYSKAIELYKDDTASLKKLYYWRGRCQDGLKEYEKAVAELDLSLKIDPGYGLALWEKSSILKKQKKYKEAIPAYSKAIAAYKDDGVTLTSLYYYRGYCHLQQKDTAKATDDFHSALDYDEYYPEPNVQLGHISFAKKNYASARMYYELNADEYYADSAELSVTYFRKAFSNFILGGSNANDVEQDLLSSIRYDSINKESHRYLADVYYGKSFFLSAEKELSKCIELYKKVKDSLPIMYRYRGLARWQQKKYKDAFTDYEQADKLQAFKSTEDIKSMGQLAFEIKEYEKASGIFSRLISLYKPEQKSELIFGYFARGRSALELKKKEMAIKDLKKALEMSPGNKDIQPWLAKAEAL